MIESEACSKLSQTSEVESFAKLVNGFKKITIFKRNSIPEIFDRQNSEYASVNYSNYIQGALSINRNFQSLSTVRNSNNK